MKPEQYGLLKEKAILFGDDNFATIIDEYGPYKNESGMLMKKFLIVPHEHLVKDYPELQKPETFTHDTYLGPALWVEYPSYWIIDVSKSRTNAIVRVLCTFNGLETPHTKRVVKYTEEIKLLETENESLRISNMYLTSENGDLLKEKKMLIKELCEIRDLMKGETDEDED